MSLPCDRLLVMENRWEWLHRINTTYGILVAIFGASAVSAVTQGALTALSKPVLSGWGYLLIAAMSAAVIAVILLHVFNSSGRQFKQAKLKILSADWGSKTSRQPVADAITKKPRDALAFFINSAAFGGCDPAEGDDNKYLQVTYSWGDEAPISVSRKQNTRIVLPEDSWAKGELKRLTDSLASLEQELFVARENLAFQTNKANELTRSYEHTLAQYQETKTELDNRRAIDPIMAAQTREDREEISKYKARIEELEEQQTKLQSAHRAPDSGALMLRPHLWIDYRSTGTQPFPHAEKLIFSTEQGAAIKIREVGPLVWNIRDEYSITLFNVTGIIRNEPVECGFTAEKMGHLFHLPDLYRQMMQRFGAEAQPTMVVSCEDMEGNLFRRRFVLSIDPSDRIVWEPVRPAKAATEPR